MLLPLCLPLPLPVPMLVVAVMVVVVVVVSVFLLVVTSVLVLVVMVLVLALRWRGYRPLRPMLPLLLLRRVGPPALDRTREGGKTGPARSASWGETLLFLYFVFVHIIRLYTKYARIDIYIY